MSAPVPPIAPTIPGTDALAAAVRRWCRHEIVDFYQRYDDGQIVAGEDLDDYAPLPPAPGAQWQVIGTIAIGDDTLYLLIPYGD